MNYRIELFSPNWFIKNVTLTIELLFEKNSSIIKSPEIEETPPDPIDVKIIFTNDKNIIIKEFKERLIEGDNELHLTGFTEGTNIFYVDILTIDNTILASTQIVQITQ